MCFQHLMLLLLQQQRLVGPVPLLLLPALLLGLPPQFESWRLLEQTVLLHVCCSAPCVQLLAVVSAFSSSWITKLSSTAVRAV
jgi:hypothetical protein